MRLKIDVEGRRLEGFRAGRGEKEKRACLSLSGMS